MAKATQHEERVLARKHALQLLYQGEILDKNPRSLIDERLLVPETQGLDEYVLMLLGSCEEHQDEIDERIVAASENWSLDRMPLVDKSLLRLATCEMCYVESVPVSVSINEAVNLAKEFGGEDSPRFINGILGRIALQLEEG
ncbi:MAG: transcription antitermination factor NusB [Eggerthellaceae bacterium]